MLVVSPLRRAIAAFFLLLFFAVVASAVCVAFGAGAIPSLTPVASVAGPPSEPVSRKGRKEGASLAPGHASAALQVAGSAPRARVGT